MHQWPNYLAYATSFITIGGIWLAHHAIFRRLRYVNTQVMRLNLLLLMTVSFLPFPTGLAAQAIRDTNAERVAVIFYGTSLLLVSVALAALWRTAARDPKLLRPEVTEQEIRAITNRATPNIGLYVGATVLAIFHSQRRGRPLPGDRIGHRGAGARRYAGARAGSQPAAWPDRQQNSSSLSPGRRVSVPPSSSS